jgi:cytochrome c553
MRCAGPLVVVAGCIAAAAMLVGCGAGEERPDPGLSAQAQRGWQAYQTLGCGSCHGDHREGKRSGPVLAGLADHWTQASLMTYLRDPPAMIKTTPRLAYKAEQYPIAMPTYGDKADEATLAALAAYLLTD